MEYTPGIHDGSIADPGFVGSSADTGKENGSGTSRTTYRRHGGVFGGYENKEGQRYLISYLVSQGMPHKQVSLYMLSHAKNTHRADRHSFTLMSKISNIHRLKLQATKSQDEVKLRLANMIALARNYVDPKTSRQTPITQCEKMRAAGVWMLNGIWDPQWRMGCLIKAMHRL
jgi:hypothetical protein